MPNLPNPELKRFGPNCGVQHIRFDKNATPEFKHAAYLACAGFSLQRDDAQSIKGFAMGMSMRAAAFEFAREIKNANS